KLGLKRVVDPRELVLKIKFILLPDSRRGRIQQSATDGLQSIPGLPIDTDRHPFAWSLPRMHLGHILLTGPQMEMLKCHQSTRHVTEIYRQNGSSENCFAGSRNCVK